MEHNNLIRFSSFALQGWSRVCLSTSTFDGFDKNEIEDDDFLYDQKEIEPQGVDPRKGWGFRGVHKVLISLFGNEIFLWCCTITWDFLLLFLYVGYYMRQSWAGSCAKNIKEWKNYYHIYCWDRGYVWPKDCWKWKFAKTSSMASDHCAQWNPGSIFCSTAIKEVCIGFISNQTLRFVNFTRKKRYFMGK